jgi:hypothetical protein
MVLFVVCVRTDDTNQHFEDARYYLKRAGETAKAGIAEELEPTRERFQELTGDEEPDAGRGPRGADGTPGACRGRGRGGCRGRPRGDAEYRGQQEA